MTDKLPLSVVILTLNEERNLPECLRSVANCDDVVILDSGSTDRTVAIAHASGARVFSNPFKDFASQRNHAHATIRFRHPWVFHLDADETMLPELADECARLGASDSPDGYYAAPRMMFHGRWLRRCTDFPAWQARCVKAAGFRFVQAGHGQREAPEMRMGFLKHSYLHDISVDNEDEWNRRHRRYAREEAAEVLTSRVSPGGLLRNALFGAGLTRRRALKLLSYSLPFRPFLRFFYQFVVRGGFADGPGAWRYCLLLARYERFAREELKIARAKAHA